MNNWLVQHAEKNIWCQPANDQRWLFKPARLMSSNGTNYGFQTQGFSIRLPKTGAWFHAFQIGSFQHTQVGIKDLGDRWVRLDRIVNAYGILITVYTLGGRTIPLEYVWIRKIQNGNTVICIEQVEGQQDFSVADPYIRFYQGEFLTDPTYTNDYKCQVIGTVVKTPAERAALMLEYNKLLGLPGEVFSYINGWMVDDLKVGDVTLWDYVEFVYDGLVEVSHYLPVSTLSSYHSTLDDKRKFLLHLPKQTDTIHFINDISLALFKGKHGVFFHQNKSESLRQVTHNDYGLLVNRLNAYILDNDDWTSMDELTLKVTVRRSGMDRPLIFTHNRIKELYKLDDAQIVSAVSGMSSSVPEWTAAVLEKSAYNRIMAARYGSITKELCTTAYGYNAVTKYAADTPTKVTVVAGRKVAMLTTWQSIESTAYEYDATGEMIGFYPISQAGILEYVCSNSNCALVEVIIGKGSGTLPLVEDAIDYVIDPLYSHRFYLNILKDGAKTYEYEDVTDSDAYEIVDNKVVWDVDLERRSPAVLSNKGFLAYGFEGTFEDGHIKFSIDNWYDGSNYRPLSIQLETLDIWLEGKLLVPNIDYFVKWPQIVICNKEHLPAGQYRETPWIDVRCRGLAIEHKLPKTGYVVNHLISNNGTFDIRDDKVVHIGVGGATLHREDLIFREDSTVGDNALPNGRPYLINDPTIPLKDLVSEDTYVLRSRSIDVDERIESYLTHYLPTPPDIEHNPITVLYKLFSPIMNKVIRDMLAGDLVPKADDELYYISTAQFDELMAPYRYLLDYEPTLRKVDLRYVTVHPHYQDVAIELTPIQMSLVERLNDRYLNNKVIINKLLNIRV